MASLFGIASSPSDNGTQGGTTTATLTPPASMVSGDLVLVLTQSRSTATFSIANNGGQSWTSLTPYVADPSIGRVQWHYAVFDGTWDANPQFSSAATAGVPFTALMVVFRGNGAGWTEDVALASGSASAPSSPFTMTRAGVTPTAPSAIAIAVFSTNDDNTFDSLSGSGWALATANQVRNATGSQQSIGVAYKIQTSADATGSVSLNQATNGGDAYGTAIMAFAEGSGDREATASQTVAGFSQAAAAIVVGTAVASQSIGEFALAFTVLGLRSATASQAVGDFAQAAAIARVVDGVASQAVSDFTQTATAANRGAAAASQTIGDFAQSVAISGSGELAAAQTVADFAQAVAATAAVAATGGQTVGEFVQTAQAIAIAAAAASQEVDDFALAAALGGVNDMVAAQTVADFAQSAVFGSPTVNRLMTVSGYLVNEDDDFITGADGLPIAVDLTQHVGEFAQVATAQGFALSRELTAGQAVQPFAQSSAAASVRSAVANQTVDGFGSAGNLDSDDISDVEASQQVGSFDTFFVAQRIIRRLMSATQPVGSFGQEANLHSDAFAYCAHVELMDRSVVIVLLDRRADIELRECEHEYA
ncbi:MAG: hypothetical protein AB7G13_30210 [Lautropia sp.]